MEDDEIASSLREVSSRINKNLWRHMDPGGFSIIEGMAVSLISRKRSMTAADVASRLFISAQSMSQIIKRLEERGIIQKKKSPRDSRRLDLSLTPTGKEWVKRLRQERDAWLTRVIAERLTIQEKETLGEAMDVLLRLSSIE
jgi:DNA-binding MarR family transcriptional regulator